MMPAIKAALTVLSLLLLTIKPAFAEAPAAIFSALKGEWSAKGEAFGGKTTTRMVWSEALAGEFYRVDYRMEIKSDNGAQTFEGVGHYQIADDSRIAAFWADNSGDLHPITAEISETAIVSHWGKAGGKQGRTEYRLNEDGSVLVTDWLLTAEGWKQFNQGQFRRRK